MYTHTHTHTHTHIGARFNVLLVILLIILPMLKGWAQEKEFKPKIVVDTILFKEFSEQTKRYLISKDEDDLPDFYDEEITLYEVYEKDDRQAMTASQGVKPTVFLLPGGGFLELTASDSQQMSPNFTANFTLAKRLAASPYNYKVIYVNYSVLLRLRHKIMLFPTVNPTQNYIPLDNIIPIRYLNNTPATQCASTQNELGKAQALQPRISHIRVSEEFYRVINKMPLLMKWI